MGLVDAIARGLAPAEPARARRSVVQAGSYTDDTAAPLAAFLGVGNTQAGRPLTFDQALGFDAVFGCIRVMADAIGGLPIITYDDLGDDRRRKVRRGDRVAGLLHLEPNPEMSAIDAWSMVGAHLNGHGDSFLGKQFAMGQLAHLWPIPPERMEVERRNGVKVYRLRSESGRLTDRVYTDAEVIHIKGLSLNGLRGLSPIGLAREAIAAGLAMDEYLNSFYGNSGVPRGALHVKGELDDAAKERLRRGWDRLYRGPKNAHRVAILEEDMKFEPITISSADLEFVAQQNLSALKACRIFRVPPSLLFADYSKASLTYRTTEGENMQFLTHSLRPWLMRIEQALNRDRDAFPSRDRYCEFLADALLRVDTLTRYRAFQIATGGKAWMKPGTEVRPRENLESDPSFDEAPAGGAAGGDREDDRQALEGRLQTLEQELEQLAAGYEHVEKIASGRIRLGR